MATDRHLEQFSRAFRADAKADGPFPSWSTNDTVRLLGRDVPSFTSFLQTHASTSFNGGAFRLLRPEQLVSWNAAGGWRDEWPQYGRLVVFASDWRGRLFGFDSSRIVDGEPRISMLDAGGAAELLNLESDFSGFLGEELVDYADEVIDAATYGEWLRAGNAGPLPNECVGYVQPPFIGGAEDFSNMSVTDLEVYIDLSGQLWKQVADLPEGAPIRSVTIA